MPILKIYALYFFGETIMCYDKARKGVVTMGAHIKSKKEKFETHMNQTGGNENVRR